MKSKKWAQRRPVKVTLRSPSGWHVTVKFRRDNWLDIEAAARELGMTIEEFFVFALRDAVRRAKNLPDESEQDQVR